MKRLIDEARGSVEIVTLTVVSTNLRALRFYERWGFRAYGVEERSAKNGDGDYLDETLMALSISTICSENKKSCAQHLDRCARLANYCTDN